MKHFFSGLSSSFKRVVAALLIVGFVVEYGLIVPPSAALARRRDGLSVVHGNSNIVTEKLAATFWSGELGKKIVEAGVIDLEKLEAVYFARGGLGVDEHAMMNNGGGFDNEFIVTEENSGFFLNLLWALGLANQNPILDGGEMTDVAYGGAGNFASTGGWTLSVGNSMDHYSAHEFVKLSPEEQSLVEKVSMNIYRPCCDNTAHFPDCNHGMAMLGLLELLASQGFEEEEMYRMALKFNARWFLDEYRTIERFLVLSGTDFSSANPKDILGKDYSSATGYRRVESQVSNPLKGNGGCAV